VTLAVIGPFTLTGYCFVTTGSTVEAETFLTTSQEHVAYAVIGYAGKPDFGSTSGATTGAQQIGVAAQGSAGSPGIASHEPAFLEVPGGTSAEVFDSASVYLGSGGGATEPACSWWGFYSTS
jgi:hypothetical protein